MSPAHAKMTITRLRAASRCSTSAPMDCARTTRRAEICGLPRMYLSMNGKAPSVRRAGGMRIQRMFRATGASREIKKMSVPASATIPACRTITIRTTLRSDKIPTSASPLSPPKVTRSSCRRRPRVLMIGTRKRHKSDNTGRDRSDRGVRRCPSAYCRQSAGRVRPCAFSLSREADYFHCSCVPPIVRSRY